MSSDSMAEHVCGAAIRPVTFRALVGLLSGASDLFVNLYTLLE